MRQILTLRLTRRHRAHLAVWCLGVAVSWLFPQFTAAQSVAEHPEAALQAVDWVQVQTLRFPETELRPARYVMRLPVTAYSSTPDQTDDTPFMTASGTHVRWGVVAANFLPIGTHVRLPDHYGDQVFVVEDRMNARYDKRLDIWMETREAARQWGLRRVTLEVL